MTQASGFQQADVSVSWVRINGQWVAVNSKSWHYSEIHRQWEPQKVEGWEWDEKQRMWVPR